MQPISILVLVLKKGQHPFSFGREGTIAPFISPPYDPFIQMFSIIWMTVPLILCYKLGCDILTERLVGLGRYGLFFCLLFFVSYTRANETETYCLKPIPNEATNIHSWGKRIRNYRLQCRKAAFYHSALARRLIAERFDNPILEYQLQSIIFN